MILRVTNIANGTLTINMYNRVLNYGEHMDIVVDVYPYEVRDLESKGMIRVNTITKPEVKPDSKPSKNKFKEE